MTWVKFIDDFDWKPRPPVTIAYKAGMVINVTRAAAAAAVARGKARRMIKTHRDMQPIEEDNDRPDVR